MAPISNDFTLSRVLSSVKNNRTPWCLSDSCVVFLESIGSVSTVIYMCDYSKHLDIYTAMQSRRHRRVVCKYLIPVYMHGDKWQGRSITWAQPQRQRKPMGPTPLLRSLYKAIATTVHSHLCCSACFRLSLVSSLSLPYACFLLHEQRRF
jgi:hypothetical protein